MPLKLTSMVRRLPMLESFQISGPATHWECNETLPRVQPTNSLAETTRRDAVIGLCESAKRISPRCLVQAYEHGYVGA
ncbi:hypothetical protein WN48_06546 [Eufriesea mexicana]|uniref:Uncharacterized protein n=1 Tax=Eufriesea mexicana TaxID=516756 RepID=A0A310S8M3_9HYME|nr:hypothetical protein WN48_06546 [Eufriesea mexicana]